MGSTAILAIRIIGDAQDAVKAFGGVEKSTLSMSDMMDRASVGAGLALGAIGAAALSCANAASEAQQAAGAVDSVFGEFSDNVHEYANAAADAVGLAKDQYGNLAAVIGSQLKNMGVSTDELVGQTDDLISMGADLAATFGGTTSDAVSALSSLLRGERDPIEKYGVSIKQADIDAQKAAMGLAGLTGEADKSATTQATLALLMNQTSAAQGQFARESDTAAGMQQRATAEWQNAQIALGEQLLPVMTEAASIAADMAKWIGENSDTVTLLAGSIGVLAAGILVINGAMKVYAGIQAIQTAAQWASNAAWLASPITWIILAVVVAIAAVVAIVILVITYWDQLKAAADIVWGAIMNWIQDLIKWLNLDKYWNALVAGFNWIKKTADDVWGNIIGGIKGVISWIKDAIGWFGSLFGAQEKTSNPKNPVTTAARSMAYDPLAFEASAAMRGISGASAYARSAPAAAPMSISIPTPSAGFAAVAARPVVNNTWKITINDAYDPAAVGEALDGVLTKHARATGSLPAAGGNRR